MRPDQRHLRSAPSSSTPSILNLYRVTAPRTRYKLKVDEFLAAGQTPDDVRRTMSAMSTRSRIRATGAIAVVVIALLASGVGDAPAVAATAECAPVLVLGARGSGEPSAGTAADGGSGLGRQTYAAALTLKHRLAGVDVVVEAVPYPAASMTVLAADPGTYFAGLENGVAWTRARIGESVARCPDQRVVLIGYSQGAMVMHRAIQDLVAAGDTAALSRLDGAVLLADGDRAARDGVRRWGTAKHGVGLARQLPALSGARSTPIPRDVAQRVHSVCDRGDSVCDATGASGPSAGGGDVHTTHYLGSKPVRRAVGAVAARVQAALRGGR